MNKNVEEAAKKYAEGFLSEYRSVSKDSFIAGVEYQEDNQWKDPSKELPNNEFGKQEGYSIEVLGMFKDGSFCKCNVSIEEKIWFVDVIVCDEPILWTYLPKIS